jgi:uncharacterized protein involved in exopolysaccharide biosynthesis
MNSKNVTANEALPIIPSEARQSIPPYEDDEDEINLIDTLQVVVDNLRLLILGPLSVGVLALGITFFIPPTYTAKVTFIPPKQQQSSAAAALADLGVLGGAAGAIAGVKNPADQYIALAKSNSVLDALSERFKLGERYDKTFRDDIRKALADNTRAEAGAKDGLISIEVDDTDAQMAANICNSYVDELRKLLNRVALTESQLRRAFFEKQVTETRANMARAEAALKNSGVDSSALKLSAVTALEGVARLRAQIAVQEVKLAAMRGFLADTAPDFLQAQTELTALRNQLEKAKKDDTTDGQSEYVTRFREFKFQEALLSVYMRQFEMARIDESREGAVIQVVDTAQAPDRKSNPKKGQIAMISTLTAALALLVFVFIRNAMRSEDQTPESAEKLARLQQSWFKFLGRRPLNTTPTSIIASEAQQSINPK